MGNLRHKGESKLRKEDASTFMRQLRLGILHVPNLTLKSQVDFILWISASRHRQAALISPSRPATPPPPYLLMHAKPQSVLRVVS